MRYVGVGGDEASIYAIRQIFIEHWDFLLWGCLLGLPGLLLTLFVLAKRSYRSNWFRRVNKMAATAWVASFPFGTVFGVLLFYLVLKKYRTIA